MTSDLLQFLTQEVNKLLISERKFAGYNYQHSDTDKVLYRTFIIKNITQYFSYQDIEHLLKCFKCRDFKNPLTFELWKTFFSKNELENLYRTDYISSKL